MTKQLVSILLLGFFVLLPCLLQAQNSTADPGIEIYGLFNNPNESDPAFNDFVVIDPNTAQPTVLGAVPSIQGVHMGSAAFDFSDSRYMFWANTYSGQTNLYIVNAETGQLLQSDEVIETPYEIEYDMQNEVLYGIRFDLGEFNPILGVIVNGAYLVSINPATNEVAVVSEVPGLTAIGGASSSFDSNNGRFIFHGIDDNNTSRIYSVDVNTGDIVNNPEMEGLIHGMQYSIQQEKLYALYTDIDASVDVYDIDWFLFGVNPDDYTEEELTAFAEESGLLDSANSNDMYIVEIDVTTGEKSIITSLDTYASVGGAYTFDQQSDTYIFIGLDGTPSNSQGKFLHLIDVVSGEIETKEPIDNVIELRCDNTRFAKLFYAPVTTTPEINPFNNNYPISFSNTTNNDWSIKTDLNAEDYDDTLPTDFTIININGQVVEGPRSIDLGAKGGKTTIISPRLIPGIYLISLQNGKNRWTQKIIQR